MWGVIAVLGEGSKGRGVTLPFEKKIHPPGIPRRNLVQYFASFNVVIFLEKSVVSR